MQPGDREPAPAPLRLVQEFVNTRDVMERTDALASRAALAAWALRRGLLDGSRTPSADDHRRALDAREALRALLLANNGLLAAPAELDVLGAVAERASISLCFESPAAPPRLVAHAAGVDGALGTILVAVYEASRTGDWLRLKACRDETCQWAFYDSSRNRRGLWCTMSMCGGRAKARAYRERQRVAR